MKYLSLTLMFSMSFISSILIDVHAQNTCSTSENIVYSGPGYATTSAFSTVGIPNDNSSALPPYCSVPIGKGGQRWF